MSHEVKVVDVGFDGFDIYQCSECQYRVAIRTSPFACKTIKKARAFTAHVGPPLWGWALLKLNGVME